MAKPEHLAKLKKGVEAWNAWRTTTSEPPDLTDADLNQADLSGADLHNALLDGASLRHARLDGADLTNADASNTDLFAASLKGTRLDRAYLINADLSVADLTDATARAAVFALARFSNTTVENTDFSDAELVETLFGDTKLSTARGLERVVHQSPSTIGIDTFFKSGGLPESFLRGCGVPEEFITYASSLIGSPIEYYSCFLSYSSKDSAFARRLYDRLQRKSIRTWFAPEDLKIGDRFRSRIDESIRLHDKLVVILSAQSIASDWVETEVEAAMERERKEKRLVLFPIAMDDAVFESQEAWAAHIRRTRHIGDFRNDFETAFGRLVRDLKKGAQIVMR